MVVYRLVHRHLALYLPLFSSVPVALTSRMLLYAGKGACQGLEHDDSGRVYGTDIASMVG